MSRLNARFCATVLALGALPTLGAAANLNPPKVTATTGEQVSMRHLPGYEARCFKDSTTRERGNWLNGTKTSSDHRTQVEVRNGVEYLGMTFQIEKFSLKALMELTPEGSFRKVPPLFETDIPGFEKEYRPMLTQLVTRLMSSMLDNSLTRKLDIGRDYGPTLDVCTGLGVQSSGTPKGTTVIEGTLNYSGRPAFLLTQTYEQACLNNGVRFSVEGTGWAVHDKASGLAMGSGAQFNLFSQGTRFAQVEEFMECGVTEKN